MSCFEKNNGVNYIVFKTVYISIKAVIYDATRVSFLHKEAVPDPVRMDNEVSGYEVCITLN